MSDKEFLYDAFISYRHTELDKYIAETLHKKMESFKAPKKVLKKANAKRQKISRVFRDKDELPLASNLEETIVEALKNSEFLIVICSPRLKESIWCRKEIETFISMHGRNKVLAVLIEGEPSESFPEELLYDYRTVTDVNGITQTVKVPIEPLAADFRGKNKTEIKKAMKDEILRLLAPMFGVSYDDLKQRHHEQKVRKIAIMATLISLLGIAFGSYSTFMALRINHQKNEIEEQKERIEEQNQILANEQARFLAEEAIDYLSKDDRKNAIRYAYYANTEFQGVTMPDQAEAERALAECVYAYETGDLLSSYDQIVANNALTEMKVSEEGDYLLTYDTMGYISAFDIKTRELLCEVYDSSVLNDYDFIDNTSFYYVTKDDSVKIVDLLSGDVKECSSGTVLPIVYSCVLSKDKSFLIVCDSGDIKFYDSHTGELTKQIELEEGLFAECVYLSNDPSVIFVIDEKEDFSSLVIGLNIESEEILYSAVIKDADVNTAFCADNDILYVLSNKNYDYMNASCFVTAIDVFSGEIIFNNMFDSIYAQGVIYSNDEKNAELLITGSRQAYQIDALTGEKLTEYTFTDKIVKVLPYTSACGFLIYSSEGECYVAKAEPPYDTMAIELINCNNLIQFENSVEGVIGIVENDNRVVFYKYIRNKEAVIYDKEIKEPIATSSNDADAKQWADSVGLEKASFVMSHMIIEDANMILVSYIDGSIKLFRADTLELLNTYDNCERLGYSYLGNNGDYYIVDAISHGYIFDKNGGLRAKIKKMAGISPDNENILVYGQDEYYNSVIFAIPLYTKEALLERAAQYLESIEEE